MTGPLQWTVVIPLKALPAAKSRLAESLPPHQHVDVVEAIRADTIAAALAAPGVARVLVVVDRGFEGLPTQVLTLVQTIDGLNGGLAEAARTAATRWPSDGVAALVGDLPALTSAELGEALGAAAAHGRSFVPDASGTGTTLLAARPGVDLSPAFGTDSATRHAETAASLEAGRGLRADVDTASELQLAREIGVGTHTRALFDSLADL